MRSAPERLTLWATVVAGMACVLPWYSDDGLVWGVGLLALVFAVVGGWLALSWRSPVAVALVLGVGALLSLVGLGVGGAYEAVTPFPFVALLAFGVGIVGAMRQAPAR